METTHVYKNGESVYINLEDLNLWIKSGWSEKPIEKKENTKKVDKKEEKDDSSS